MAFEGGGLLSPAHRQLSIAVYLTIALIAFEGTSVAAALPAIASELGNVALLPWVITGFLVTLGLSTVLAGPVVDAIGSRRLFTWSVVAFTSTGVAAGMAGDVVWLVGIRLLQGSASGFLFAAGIAAVNLGYPGSLTGRAFAANSTVWGIMGATAPGLAALLLEVASWRWIFFINAPLGLIAFVAGRTTMPERLAGAEPLHLDVVGAVLAGVFTVTTVLAVDGLGEAALGYAMVAVVSLAAYLRHARRVPRPLVRLEHIAEQPYLSLALVPAAMLAAGFCSNVYVTLYTSAGRGWSTGGAAWSVLFFTIGWTIGANLSSRLLDRQSAVSVMAFGLGTSIMGCALTAGGSVFEAPIGFVFGGLTLVGIGVGLTTNASLTELRSATPKSAIGRASAANQFARSQGFAVGAAAGGAVLLLVVDRQLGSVEVVRGLLSGDDMAGDSSDAEAIAHAVRDGYSAASVVALVVMCSGIEPMRRLLRRVNDQGESDPLGSTVQ